MNLAGTLRWREPQALKQLPFPAFVPLLRAGVDAAPERTDLQLQLARALYHTDRMAELVERLAPVVARGDADAELVFFLGRAAAALDDDALALEALTSAAERGFGLAFGYLAEVLNRLGRSDEALAAGLRGLEHAPFDSKALALVADALLARDERERLWSLCTELRARGAWDGYVPSVMALAATTPAQRREVAALLDPARWLSAAQLSVSDDFDRRLASELLAHPSLSPLPSTKATAGAGRRIDQLDVEAGPLARELLARIRDAADRYVTERLAFDDHPMIARRPALVKLNSWALSVHHDGHETWHLHPSGWLSGVYYVKVPETQPRPDRRAGTIEFASNAFGREPASGSWPHHFVTPRAGLLLLFPAYFAHRTWPTGVGDPRICVAFDVMAARPTAERARSA